MLLPFTKLSEIKEKRKKSEFTFFYYQVCDFNNLSINLTRHIAVKEFQPTVPGNTI